jgi:hypothetical protein
MAVGDAIGGSLVRGNARVEPVVVIDERDAESRGDVADHFVDLVAVEVEIGLEHHRHAVTPGQLDDARQVVLELPSVRRAVERDQAAALTGPAGGVEELVRRGSSAHGEPGRAAQPEDAQRVEAGARARGQNGQAVELGVLEAPVRAVGEVVVVVVPGEDEQQVGAVLGELSGQVAQGLRGVRPRQPGVDREVARRTAAALQTLDQPVRPGAVGCALGPRVSHAENAEGLSVARRGRCAPEPCAGGAQGDLGTGEPDQERPGAERRPSQASRSATTLFDPRRHRRRG